MKVKYLDCTNFEGIKILVFKGIIRHFEELDPHFYESDESPIARFKPTKEGWKMAIEFAKGL